MIKNFVIMILAALGFAACTTSPKTNEAEENDAKKVLVLYYSQTGVTKSVAEEIQAQLGADIEAIEVEEAYDGDFNATIERCQKETAEGILPTVKDIKANLDEYDVVFLGYPIWFGTYAKPIEALVKKIDFAGKKIVPFCTFGSGGLQASTQALKSALPKAEVAEGYGVRTVRVDAAKEELNRFLIEWGYKEGEVEALPAFMEEKPCTDEEVKIFDEACGDYQYPLGTPVTVAVRETETSTDYLYTASSKGQDGSESTSKIYVTVKKAEGSKAEFTMVER